MFTILSLACALIFIASAGFAAQYGENVGSDDLADSRTLLGPDNYDPSAYPSTVQGNSTGGLDGLWMGNDFTISWLIEYDPDTGYWTYNYTLIGSQTPSSFILEFTDTGDVNNDENSIWDLVINGNSAEVGGAKDEFGTWNNNGGIDLTNPIYGHKLEITGGSPASTTVQFTTTRAPVWGNFRTMGATSNNAYNIGLSTPFSTDPLYFIARPGSPPACPDIDSDGYVVCNATCDPGALLCGDCNENDPSINPGAPEICSDRKDNDCDGKKDKGDPQGCIVCTPTGMPEDICNGLDDDCDGLTDEDYAATPTTCGQGECSGNAGQLECQGGSEVDTCDPLAGAAADDTTCDGLDNDCNGVADDGYVSTPTTCGAGECSAAGQLECQAGTEVNTCSPETPTAEICDGLDNNCDGTVDENLTQPTTCGVGECGSTGVETCTAGVWGNDTCTEGTPTAEICDDLDNNCDGSVDENLTQPTTCGAGECAGNTGIETCTAGVWGNDTCDPLAGAALDDSVCNGLDDDCDGQIDEDYVVDNTCGAGICWTNNTSSSCVGGVETQCQKGTPSETPETTCNDGVDNDCDGQTDTNDADCLAASYACVPPVRQEIGIQDVLYNSLVETDCRLCHENPEQFPVLDVSMSDRHHLLTNTVIPNPTDAPFGSPGNVYECLTCHDTDNSSGIVQFLVERDCVVCHVQASSQMNVHHRTDLAQGNLPQGPDCQACHGGVVNNRDDGHFVPSFDPTSQTPRPSGGTGLPLNCRDEGAGSCTYCHDNGTFMGEIPVESNITTHHNTGFGSDDTKCDWCHDFSLPPEAQMRICENCHGRDSLHNIQADSDGDNVIQPGIEQPFYGHIGNPDDCWGCHGFGPEELTAPETGAVVPSISSISNSVLTEGTDNTVTLSGTAFTNMNEGIELSSDVILIAPDGSTITLTPDSISQDSVAVTIPNNLLKGNYKLKTVKLNKRSNPKIISIKPAVKITQVECMPRRGRIIINGLGFDDSIEGADAYLNVKVNGKVADILSWRNNRIKVSVTRCSDSDNVTVKALFGSATTDNAPLKPDKGR